MRKGSALGTTIILTTLSLVMLLLMGQMCVFHLQFSSEVERRQQALNLAESAIHEGLAALLADDTYGGDVRVTHPDYPEGSFGQLTFAHTGAWSTNNLKKNVNAAGWERVVPPSAAHLVGTGRVGGVTEVVEAVYVRPPFPKAMLASGPIEAKGHLSVSGVAAGAPADNRLPGSIASNSASTDPAHPAIRIGPACSISGDVSAPGRIDVDAAAHVGGSINSQAGPQPVPPLDVPMLISRVRTVTGTQVLAGTLPSTTVDWYSGCTGSLRVEGDLILKDGVLWVDQDLVVTGGIQGQGLVLVKGNVEIQAGTALGAQNLVALAAGGDVTLRGQDRSSYYFQGMVYTEGNLIAREITVLGSVVANGAEGRGGIELENVNLVQTVGSVETNYGIPQRSLFYDPNKPPGTPPDQKDTYLSISPNWDPASQKYRYTVHVICTNPKRLVNQTWADLHDDPNDKPKAVTPPGQQPKTVQQLAYDIYNDRPAVDGNAGTRDTILKTLAKVRANPTAPEVMTLSLNNLLAPSERARVLLWHHR